MKTPLATKLCSICRASRPLAAFYLTHGRPDGRCRDCAKHASRAYRAANVEVCRERAKIRARQERLEFPDRVRARQSRYEATHPERIAALSRARQERYRLSHRDVLRARARSRYWANPALAERRLALAEARAIWSACPELRRATDRARYRRVAVLKRGQQRSRYAQNRDPFLMRTRVRRVLFGDGGSGAVLGLPQNVREVVQAIVAIKQELRSPNHASH